MTAVIETEILCKFTLAAVSDVGNNADEVSTAVAVDGGMPAAREASVTASVEDFIEVDIACSEIAG